MTTDNKPMLKKLCGIVGADLITNHSMTTDEIIDCLGCYVDDDGEIINGETGKPTGIWWEDLDAE
jgi:hypothetical protein